MSGGVTDRDLFLHELIDIVGQHQWDYMEHAKAQAGHEKVGFELLGTWYTMGITGRWPQVVNVWEIPIVYHVPSSSNPTFSWPAWALACSM